MEMLSSDREEGVYESGNKLKIKVKLVICSVEAVTFLGNNKIFIEIGKTYDDLWKLYNTHENKIIEAQNKLDTTNI